MEPRRVEAEKPRGTPPLVQAGHGRGFDRVLGHYGTDRGAHTQQVLASVLRTIQQRQLDASEIFSGLLRAPQPISALAPPTAVQ